MHVAMFHCPLQVVLVGDPCQLGPVLSSRLAGSSGLGMSLLERLMETKLYRRQEDKFKDHGSYDPLLVSHGLLVVCGREGSISVLGQHKFLILSGSQSLRSIVALCHLCIDKCCNTTQC